MKRKNSYLLFSILLFIFLVLPWMYFIDFTVLQMDDFCRTNFSFTAYFSGVKNWYLSHNGRYVNALLALLPVYDLEVYRIVLVFLFLLFGYALFNLLYKLLNNQSLKTEWPPILYFSLIVLIGIIAVLPDLNEFFYWYAAASVYQFSAILFLFFISSLITFWFNGKLHFKRLLFLAVLINGNLELLAGITNLLLLISFSLDLKRRKRPNYRLIILNLVSWISTAIVIFAPGMTERRSFYDYGGDFLGATKVAILYGAKFIAISVLDLTSILLIVFSLLFVWKRIYKTSKKLTYVSPPLLLLVSYLSIITMVFIIYYATGTFDSGGESRVHNLMHLVTLIFVMINIVNLCYYLRNKVFLLKAKKTIIIISTFAMLLSLTLNGNYRSLVRSIYKNEMDNFRSELAARKEVIKKGGDTLDLKYITGQGVLKTGDEFLKKEVWVQECYLDYVNTRYNKNFKAVRIVED